MRSIPDLVNIVTMPVIARAGGAIYLRLPRLLQENAGACSCDYCKAHPDEKPMWDTIAVEVKTVRHRENDWSWRLHMPDPQAFMEAMRKPRVDCPENDLTPASGCGTMEE